MPMMQVSDPIYRRIKEIQTVRSDFLGRKVSMSEVVEVLFDGYDATVKRESEENSQ